MPDLPTLFFCVGATKAGTSWLNDYLTGHPDCHLRGVKELHYFDGIDLGSADKQRDRIAAQIATIEKRLAQPGRSQDRRPPRLTDLEDLLALHQRPEDPQGYLAYLMVGRTTQKVIADITPAYALLPVERLRMMERLLPETRFLYLMREPVARLWSHVRMVTRRLDGGDDQAAAVLQQTLTGRNADIGTRSDYRAAVERLTQAIPPERLLVMYFEDMMTPAGIARICAFLGIEPRPADFGTVVNAGPALKMRDRQQRAARDWLEPQYRFAADYMGRLPEAWQAQRAQA